VFSSWYSKYFSSASEMPLFCFLPDFFIAQLSALSSLLLGLINAVVRLFRSFASAHGAMAARQMYTTRSVIVNTWIFPGNISATPLLILTRGQKVRLFDLRSTTLEFEPWFGNRASYLRHFLAWYASMTWPNGLKWPNLMQISPRVFQNTDSAFEALKRTKMCSKLSITQREQWLICAVLVHSVSMRLPRYHTSLRSRGQRSRSQHDVHKLAKLSMTQPGIAVSNLLQTMTTSTWHRIYTMNFQCQRVKAQGHTWRISIKIVMFHERIAWLSLIFVQTIPEHSTIRDTCSRS